MSQRSPSARHSPPGPSDSGDSSLTQHVYLWGRSTSQFKGMMGMGSFGWRFLGCFGSFGWMNLGWFFGIFMNGWAWAGAPDEQLSIVFFECPTLCIQGNALWSCVGCWPDPVSRARYIKKKTLLNYGNLRFSWFLLRFVNTIVWTNFYSKYNLHHQKTQAFCIHLPSHPFHPLTQPTTT